MRPYRFAGICMVRNDSNDSPTIAMVSNHIASIVRFRGPLIRALSQRGVRVYALAPNLTAEDEQQVRVLGAIPIRYPLDRTGVNGFRDLWTTFSLWRILNRLKVHGVLTFSVKPVIFGSVAAWLSGASRRVALIEGVGYVFTDDGRTRSVSRRLLERIVAVLYRLGLGCSTHSLFLNPDDRQEFVARRWVRQHTSACIGGIGVDLDEWHYRPPNQQPITFALTARLLREKGIGEYLKAAAIVKARHPQVRFLLLGGTDTNPGAFPVSEVMGCVAQGIVEWPGHVDVAKWLVDASVFVLPSYREGVPLSTQEAMAMGRAVITTDVPGCRETVVHGKNGFLVRPRDVMSLVEAMQRFIDDPSLVESMGLESRRMAEERFDARAANERLMRYLLPAR